MIRVLAQGQFSWIFIGHPLFYTNIKRGYHDSNSRPLNTNIIFLPSQLDICSVVGHPLFVLMKNVSLIHE